MKAKTISVDPAGVFGNTVEFEIPYGEQLTYLIPLKDGQVLRGECRLKNRTMLEIGNYRYWIWGDGELEFIELIEERY